MAKCSNCGRKGLFLKLQSGLCNECVAKAKEKLQIGIHYGETMSHEEYQAMRDDEVVWLEQHYDFTSIEGINAIPVTPLPANAPSGNVTGQVEYYLLRKAEQFKKDNNVDMAIACYRKANQLMPHCRTVYSKEYFMRLPNYLRKLRRFDEARDEEAKIDILFPDGSNMLASQRQQIEEKYQKSFMHQDGSDLVEVSLIGACCGICGRYRGRIFSLKGKDKRFPLLPSDFCTKCGLTCFPFREGISTPVYSKKRGKELIREMNRPFVDSRTKEEIAMYEAKIAEALRKKQNSIEYNWLWEHHPEVCPKSLSGYSRMKSSNSDNFQKLCLIAARDGFEVAGFKLPLNEVIAEDSKSVTSDPLPKTGSSDTFIIEK